MKKKIKNKKTRKTAQDYYYFLEGSLERGIFHGDLIAIKTTDKRRKMIEEIRKNLAITPKKEELVNELLDLAIVVHTHPLRYKNQDLDNIAKIVLDALKKQKEGNSEHYFFNDDRQIVRLLIQKIQRIEDKEFETDQLSVSIRKHDPFKEMIIKPLKFLSR